MSDPERNFNNFLLAEDNVYELAGGLIPEIADRLQVDLGAEPNVDALGQLVGKLGPNKVLRDNAEVTALSPEEMAEMLDRSGVQRSLERSLWTPDITPGTQGIAVAVMTGGVANWMDRSARTLPVWFRGTAHLPTGNRVMGSLTEKANRRVAEFNTVNGHFPTEAQYAASVIMPRLDRRRGVESVLSPYETGDGGEIAHRFFEDNPALLEQKLLVVRVANAGLQLAIQMRQAARQLNPDFDRDPENPQVFVHTDAFPIAGLKRGSGAVAFDTNRYDREVANPRHFQNPQTGLRQAVLTAKVIREAQLIDAGY